MTYDLIYALAEADRTIFLAYPRHVQDASYSYSQLRDVLDPLNITRAEFVANFVHTPEREKYLLAAASCQKISVSRGWLL